MKKIISWGMMLAAAFTLTNCAKEIDAPVQEPESVGYPFEIIASTVDTKTVNDGMSTKWAAGDKINVFHAIGEENTYVNDGAFMVSDIEAGLFTGNIMEELDVEEEYDWYVIYPYNEKVTTPGTQTAGYTYIGYRNGMNQQGYNSTASLDGTACPLYGIAKYAGVRPEITMNHLSSVVAIKVTNKNEEPLTITEASFTAPEDIVGSYYIDITKSPVAYTARGDNYVSATASVNVSNGTALAKGQSAILYAAIKPFTAAAGQKLTLSVNGYSKEITLSSEVTFAAGKIKTLNFGYDYVETPSQEDETKVTISFVNANQRSSVSQTEQVWENEGVIFTNTKTSESSNVVDNVNPVRLYKNSIITLSAPSNISKIEFACNSSEYATALKSSINGSTMSGTTVSIVLDGTLSEVKYTLSGGQVRLNSLTVTYVGGDYVPPVLESIAVSGNYKTEFTQGDEFSFGGIVTATYDNGSTKNVTDDCEFTGYDLDLIGDQTVTVTYEGEITTYDITVAEQQQGVVELKTFTVKSDAVVSNSGYQKYSATIDGRGWIITYGGNNKSVGTNKNSRGNCTLKSYSKYAVSPVTTSSTASAFASTTSIRNVSKISYAALSGGSNHSSTKIYLLYSADGNTFSQISLTKGTQGGVINTSNGGEFEFESCSGYFAVVFVATNTSGNWRLDDVNLTFTYSE